jgi:F-type H+-transporting ATPase subunit c
MKNLRYVFFAALSLMVMAIPTLAQVGGGNTADNESTISAYKAIAAGIGFGLAAGLAALGQGRIGASAVEGAARNPSATARIQTLMIIGLALIESLALLALVIVFVKL